MNDDTTIERDTLSAQLPGARKAGRVFDHDVLVSLGLKLLSFVAAVAIWAAGARAFNNPLLLPYPWAVARRLAELIVDESFFTHAYYTVARVSVGFSIALAIGTLAGMAMGLRTRMEQLLDAYVLVGLTVPGLAWSVLAVMWFGASEIAPVFAIVMVTTPMLAVNMWQGTKALDKQLIDMAQAFDVPPWRIARSIVAPHLAPYLLAASRFGFGLGWKVVVLSEIFGQSNGIGYMMNRAFSRFSMTDVLAWTFGFTLIMFALEFGVLRPLERRLLRWRPTFQV